jgi:hypothetical protein
VHRSPSTKLALVAVVATAMLAALSVTAFAGMTNEVSYPSKVRIKEEFPAFHGTVRASNDACVGDRRVKLFKERRGGGKKLLGKDKTEADGKWQVKIEPLKSGAYWAVVKRREEGTAGTTYVCLRDRSKTVAVD